MKILVTGGAGYIGSVLTPYLLARGWSVTVLDNFVHGVPSLAHIAHDRRLRIVRGDARSRDLMRSLLPQHDVLIPLAAVVGAPACDADPIGATSTNYEAIDMALSLMSPEQWVVYPNTNSGYGTTAPGTMCDETTPLAPISLYGKLKCLAEARVMARLNSITLRLATVFGWSPRMRLDLMVNDFTYRAVNDKTLVLFEGGFRRNFIHVRDVARAFVWALSKRPYPAGLVFNVGDDAANMTKAELCKRIARVTDFHWIEHPSQQDPDKRDYVVSTSKISSMGWHPTHDFDEGIGELVQGYAMLGGSGSLRNA